ncbi:unnamed protein product [Closterium sp. NIES-54]
MSNNGQKKAWPLMMTLANISQAKRWGKAGHTLLSLLPIPPSAMSAVEKVMLFQRCVTTVLQPLLDGMECFEMGFDDGSGKVWKLKNALYGLKQAPRQWYLKLREVLEEIGFTPSSADHSLFMLGEGEQRSFMVVYLDDILIFSPSSDLVKEVMLKLQDKFKCKALGDVSFYLALHIERDVEKRSMRMHQRKYLEALAANFGQSEGHVATLFPSGLKCVKGPMEESVGEEERRRFHSLVAAGMRVAKYLGQTLTVGLQYSAAAQRRQKGADGVEPGRLFLTAFSDASYASEPEDMTSVGGFICFVGGGPTAWESKKQVDQALSSVEFEYMALFPVGGKLAPKARWGLHLGVSPESKGWEVLELTENKVVTSVVVIFYETLSLEVWKTKFGPTSGQTQAHPPTDTSTVTVPLLTEVDEPADEDVVEVLPPSPVLAPPFPVTDRRALTSVSAIGNEGSLEASPVAPASGIAGGQKNDKLIDQDGKPSTTGEQQTGEPAEQDASAGVQSIEELSKLTEDLAVNEEGELSAGEESTDSDVVEVPITKPELRRTSQARRPPERLSFHACLPPAAFNAVYDEVDDDPLYDGGKEDEDLPELDPNMHADPEHRWDIATMMVKEALASWKGEAVKAAMEEEIRSLIGMGTWELVERPRGVNIMKNRWVLMTKYRIDDTVEHEKARLVVKGFTQACGADYDEAYSPVSSYVTLRIFLSIVAILDLFLMQLDMKNAFLQSKLDRVLYMYQPDYFVDGTGRVCKLLKSLYRLKKSPLLWHRALDGVLLGVGLKKSQVDEALYFKASDNGVTCWVLVYVDDLLAASSSPTMLKELKGLLEADFELCKISLVVNYLGLEIVRDRPVRKLWLHLQGYAVKLHRRFIDEEQGG